MIALASEYELIAQVPSWGLTPRLPAMCGTETLTMVISSTSMNVANAIATVSSASGAPCRGGRGGRASGAVAMTCSQRAVGRFAATIESASASALAKSRA